MVDPRLPHTKEQSTRSAPVPKDDPTPSPSSGPPGLDGLKTVQKLVFLIYFSQCRSRLCEINICSISVESFFSGCVSKLFSQLRREVLQDFEISEAVQRELAEIGDIWIQNKIL